MRESSVLPRRGPCSRARSARTSAGAASADAGGDDLVAFDDFADWYTDGGYKVASWLELLDLSKWVL